MKAELNLAKKVSHRAEKKIKFARTITEQRLKECLPVPTFESEHSSVLITLMSTLMDEDNFEMDLDSDTINPKQALFKELEDSLCDEECKEKLDFVRNKLLERVKDSAIKVRDRRLSVGSSVGSQDSRKRKSSTELENNRGKLPTNFVQ